MEECYYSKRLFGMYFQYTKRGYKQILWKREGQWRILFKWKAIISPDPVKYCETYNTAGCSHVDGYLCDLRSCDMNTLDKLKNYGKK